MTFGMLFQSLKCTVIAMMIGLLANSGAAQTKSSNETSLRKTVNRLVNFLSPNPFGSDRPDDRELLFHCLDFEETRQDALEEIRRRVNSDHEIAKLAMKRIVPFEPSLLIDIEHKQEEYFPLLCAMLERPETFDFAASHLMNFFESFRYGDSVLEMKKMAAKPRFRAKLKTLLDRWQLNNEFDEKWIHYQLDPDNHEDPVPEMFEHLSGKPSRERTEAIESFKNIELEAKHLDEAFALLNQSDEQVVSALANALSNSQLKWLQPVRRLLQADRPQLVANAIVCLQHMGANDIETQKRVAALWHDRKNEALRLWAFQFFCHVECEIPSIRSAALAQIQKPTDPTELVFSIRILSRQKEYNEAAIDAVASHLGHRDFRISQEAFIFLTRGNQFHDRLLQPIIRQLEKAPIAWAGGVPFTVPDASPVDWLQQYGPKSVPQIEPLLKTSNERFGLEYARLILHLDSTNSSAISYLETVLNPNHKSPYRPFVKIKNDWRRREHLQYVLSLYSQHQKDSERFSKIVMPYAIEQFQQATDDHRTEYAIEHLEISNGPIPLTATQILNLVEEDARLKKPTVDGTQETGISRKQKAIAYRWICRCQSIDANATQRLFVRFEKDPEDIDLILALASAQDPRVSSTLTRFLKPVKNAENDRRGFPATFSGFINRRPDFDRPLQLSRSAQVALALIDYEPIEKNQVIESVRLQLKQKKIESFDQICLAALLLKLEPENKMAQSLLLKGLESDDGLVCRCAMVGCRRISKQAGFAKEALRKVKFHFYPELRREASRTLERIEQTTKN